MADAARSLTAGIIAVGIYVAEPSVFAWCLMAVRSLPYNFLSNVQFTHTLQAGILLWTFTVIQSARCKPKHRKAAAVAVRLL